ncbi:MAG: hypothetical protein J2P36_39585, partial [Ktedonobacteraceae bacterium]|nr:hypothetical protein [Ktedonobacteraceae bacterium]
MKKPFWKRRFNYIALIAVVLTLIGAFALLQPKKSYASPGGAAHPFAVGGTFFTASTKPPTDAECRANQGGTGVDWPCLSPQEIRNTYNIAPLLDAGYTGKGETIVIIDSFGSPTIEQDLKIFDKGYGLPDPPSFKVLAPLGTVPFDPNDADQVSWAFEASLDVEWAHAIAPDASIVLLTSPVDETQGIAGMPEFAQLIKYALDHHLGNIISQSWGTTENTL